MTPKTKNMKDSFKKINLYFDKNITSVSKIEMIETSEDFTLIEFLNKKLNAPISENSFIIK